MKKYNSIVAVLLAFALFVVSAIPASTSFAYTGKTDASVGIMRTSHSADFYEKAKNKSADKLTKKQIDALFKKGVEYMYGTGKEGFNYKKAKEALTKAAKAGSGDAYAYLGRLVQMSSDDDRYETAMDYFNKAVKQGCQIGNVGKGLLYAYGHDVKADYDKAMKFFKKAEKAGLVEANTGFGLLYQKGWGVEESGKKAEKYFKKALKGSDYWLVNQTRCDLGTLYREGAKGLDQDYDLAMKYYRKAADAGYGEGCYDIGYMYGNGTGVELDERTSLKWVKKGMNAGHGDSTMMVAYHYLFGYLVDQDLEKGFSLSKKAAGLGSENAFFLTGFCYGHGYGTEKNYDDAFKWYKKAEKENIVGVYNELGTMYYYGLGVKADNDKAFKYFEKAVKNNNIWGYSGLGDCYYNGYGTKQNTEKAIDTYRNGAINGNEFCMYWLGHLYATGEGGMKTDYEMALKYLSAAVETNEQREWPYHDQDFIDRVNKEIGEIKDKPGMGENTETEAGPDTSETGKQETKTDTSEIAEQEAKSDTSKTGNTKEQQADTEKQDTDNAEAEGNGRNEPYSLDPSEGMHVEVGRNVLNEGTKLTVEPITEMTEELSALDEEMRSSGDYIIGAWEVDAGLNADQSLPGEYHVTFDLAAMNVPEEMYEAVRAYRAADDGTITEYKTELKDGKLSYSTNQNSVTLLTACIALAIGVPAVMAGTVAVREYNAANEYFNARYKEGSFYCEWKRKNKYGEYKIMWSMKDVDEEADIVWKRVVEIRNKYTDQVYEKYGKDRDLSKRSIGESCEDISRIADLLSKDQEYKKLRERLAAPPFIRYIDQCINHSYEYLAERERVEMPKWCLEYRLQPTKTEGNFVSCHLKNSYIEINAIGNKVKTMLSGTAEGNVDKDHLLLTIVHETFHACQSNYHTGWSDSKSNRFDEMTAVMMEYDARKYFQKKKIIKTNPDLTTAKAWGTLNIPLDYFDSSQELNDAFRDQGYLLSRFLRYLREQKQVPGIRAGDVVKSSNEFKNPSTTGPIKKTFELTDQELQKYWADFCMENKMKAAKTYWEDSATAGVKEFVPKEEIIKKNKSTHAVFSNRGDYTMSLHSFSPGRKKKPFLVKLDPGTKEKGEGYIITPAENNVSNIPGGFYIPIEDQDPDGKKDMSQVYLLMMEERSVWTGSPGELGYTVWSLDEPEKPELTLKDGQLEIQLPEPKGAAGDGVMDGLLLTIKCDGKKVEKELEKEDFGTLITYDIEELLEELDVHPEGVPQFSVTLMEFVKDVDGKLCFGLPSDEADNPDNIIDPYLGTWSHPGSTSTIWTFSLEENDLKLRISGYSEGPMEYIEFKCDYEFVDGSLKVSNSNAFQDGYVLLTMQDNNTMTATTYGPSGETVTMTRTQDE